MEGEETEESDDVFDGLEDFDRDAEDHAGGQLIHCVVRGCIAELTPATLDNHVEEAHLDVLNKRGGGGHKVYIRVDQDQLADVSPTRDCLVSSPICIRLDGDRVFYLNLARLAGSGLWTIFVIGNATGPTTNYSAIISVSGSSATMFYSIGPVNPVSALASSDLEGNLDLKLGKMCGLFIPHDLFVEKVVDYSNFVELSVEIIDRRELDTTPTEIEASCSEPPNVETAAPTVGNQRETIYGRDDDTDAASPPWPGIISTGQNIEHEENISGNRDTADKLDAAPAAAAIAAVTTTAAAIAAVTTTAAPLELATRQCPFCPFAVTAREVQKMRNHVSDHLAPELVGVLPRQRPFVCPLCGKEKRDKINLRRHFLFGHEQRFNYCPEEILKGDLLFPRLPPPPEADAATSESEFELE